MYKFLLPALVVLLASCTPSGLSKQVKKEEGVFFRKTSYAMLPGWDADRHGEALAVFLASCGRIMKKDAAEAFGKFAGTYADWQGSCGKAADAAATGGEARVFFEENFIPYEVWGEKSREGLFTGYYEPLLKGALEKKPPFLVPLYARPPDLITVNLGDFRPELKGETVMGRVEGEKLIPYFRRAEIEAGVLAAREKEIVWVDSAVDAFFLHIQGSGRVELEDGTVLRVGYAAQNGHPYLAIGKSLIERGALKRENVSMPAIRAWLEAHPEEAPDVMNLNASYVFFRPLEGEGPLGAEGVALTPRRSLAVDRRKLPYGAPLFLDAEEPEGGPRLRHLMVAQDTGGAIRGAVRGDYFWGGGEEAARKAGVMKSKGYYYILLPQTVAVPPEFSWRGPGQKSFHYND